MKLPVHKTKGLSVVTLILYVAVAIFVSSILYGAWRTAEIRTQDTRRLRDMSEIHKALELYFDKNEDYPVIANHPISSRDPEWNTLLTAINPYLNGAPRDPVNNSDFPWTDSGYSYVYITGEKDENGIRAYDLIAKLGDPTSPHLCSLNHWKIHTIPGSYSWCDDGLKVSFGSDIVIPAEPMVYSDH